MSDTSNPKDFADTIGQAVHSALIRFASLASLVTAANEDLDAGDIDKAIITIRNCRAPISELVSVQSLIYACLPRTGDRADGGF